MSTGPIMVDVRGYQLSAEEIELISHPNVGGVILFARNFQSTEQLAALCAAIRGVGRSPRLLAVDHEGGRVQRFRSGFTRIPPMANFGHLWLEDRAVARRDARAAGRTIATELAGYGIDLCFAPVLDVDHGKSQVIGDRAFSANQECVVSLASAFRQGLRDAGMAATGKHFPGHGSVVADSHAELPVDRRSMEALERDDLGPFRQLIDRGLESVMMAHVLYPSMDDLPASLSRFWIRTVLRKRMGFRGVVFCDDLSMNGARVVEDPIERAQLALDAGCDMIPICNDPTTAAAVVAGLPVKRRAASSSRLQSVYLKRQSS